MHVLPQLRKLERKYRDWFVVIGVHSSKFPNEKETENIRSAVLRYGIEHPVINDRNFTLWQQYGVRAWPTIMFIHPDGKVIGKHEGEFDPEKFDELIAGMGQEFANAGLLNELPLDYQLEELAAEERPLSFPGKITADPDSDRLIIADSGHHRVLVVDRSGEVQEIIGWGQPGAEDGPFETASFNRPQGIAADAGRLYIADSENHAIRLADLETSTLSTIAGTGHQSLFRHEGGDARKFPMNSPYDLALRDGRLYIAMAGSHQIWTLDLESMETQPFAGDGAENIGDGPLLESKLAQPYGLAAGTDALYFADSETSSVRHAAYSEDGNVETLVGTGLFDFGDQDGPFDQAVLQHAQAVALGDDLVYVADTYNNKIKVLDLKVKIVSTVAGTGKRGNDDGRTLEATFDEPAGLALIGDSLYVADTNNHAIRVISLGARTVGTMTISGL